MRRNNMKKIGGVLGTMHGRILSVIALAAVVIIGGGAAAWAQVPTSAKDYVLVKVADLAKETGNVELASKLLDSLSEPASDAFGATSIQRNVSAVSNFSQVGLMDSDKDAVLRTGYEYQRILFTTTTPVSWQNKTGEDVWVGPAFGRFVGTASTTLDVSMGTSTSSGVPYDSTSEPRGLLNRYVLATSTINGTFDSQVGALSGGAAASVSGLVQTSKFLLVKPNEYLVLFLRAEDPMWAVTSTADTGLSDRSYVGWEYRTVSTSTPL